jgi:hypothetical protein
MQSKPAAARFVNCYPLLMRFFRAMALAALLLPAFGCHSAFIDATIRNRTSQPLSLVELDYPSASFGTQTLAPGADFHYRFKLLGSGDLKLIYTDAARQEHDITGPSMNEGDEGSLTVSIGPRGVEWTPQLKPHH